MYILSGEANLLIEPVAVDIPPSDADLAWRIKQILMRHYPGYMWAIEIPQNQNVVIIRNYDLDPNGKWCMMNYKTEVWSDPSLKKMVRAAGEFLERGNRLRGRWRREDQPLFPVLDHG